MRRARPTIRLYRPKGKEGPDQVLVEIGEESHQTWSRRGYRPLEVAGESRGAAPGSASGETVAGNLDREGLAELDLDGLRALYDELTGEPPNPKWNQATLVKRISEIEVEAPAEGE